MGAPRGRGPPPREQRAAWETLWEGEEALLLSELAPYLWNLVALRCPVPHDRAALLAVLVRALWAHPVLTARYGPPPSPLPATGGRWPRVAVPVLRRAAFVVHAFRRCPAMWVPDLQAAFPAHFSSAL